MQHVFSLVLCLLLPICIHAWSFTTVEGGSCGPLTLTWANGNPPFTARIHPVNGTAMNYDIPDSAFSSGQGSYEIQLPFEQGQEFLVTMGDRDGILTGGTSALFTTGAQTNSTSCDTKLLSPQFFWSAPSASTIAQCQQYSFTQIGTSSGAQIVRPTTLLVLIPGGNDSYTIQMPEATSYAWTVDTKAGTQIVLDMFDSQDHQGGVSDKLSVQSGSSSCTLHSNVQASSTGSSIGSVTASTTGAATTQQSDSSNSRSGLPTAAVVGIVIGSILVIAVVALGIFFCARRRRSSGGPRAYNGDGEKIVMDDSVLPMHIEPFRLPPPVTDAASSYHSSANSTAEGNYPTKAQMAAQQDFTPGFVQYQDSEDDLPPEPLEVPPGYSQSRAPLPIFQVHNGGPPVGTSKQREQPPRPQLPTKPRSLPRPPI